VPNVVSRSANWLPGPVRCDTAPPGCRLREVRVQMEKLKGANLLTQPQLDHLLGFLDDQAAMDGRWHTTGGACAACSRSLAGSTRPS